MREIKFRAWDLNEDEYILWDRLIRTVYNQDYFRMNGKGKQSLSILTDTGILLEQFTGLRDKNGKEIYEGDIVKHYGKATDSDWIGRCEYNYDRFMLKWNQGGYASAIDWSECEVIGNTHESPELLK